MRRTLFTLLAPMFVLAAACTGEVTGDFGGDPAFLISGICATDGTCVPACEDTGDEVVCENAVPPSGGGCWVTGIGHLLDVYNNDGKDNFGGNGMPMKDGRIRGEWEHVDHGTGVKYHAKIAYLVCQHVDEPGPGVPNGPNHDFNINEAFYGGPARKFTPGLGWADGYWIDIVADDHGEPGNKPGPGHHGSGGPDTYVFTAREYYADVNDVSPVEYIAGTDINGGNFQIHPPVGGHPYTIGTLPAWLQ